MEAGELIDAHLSSKDVIELGHLFHVSDALSGPTWMPRPVAIDSIHSSIHTIEEITNMVGNIVSSRYIAESEMVGLMIPCLRMIHGREAERGSTVASMIPGAAPVLPEKKVI